MHGLPRSNGLSGQFSFFVKKDSQRAETVDGFVKKAQFFINLLQELQESQASQQFSASYSASTLWQGILKHQPGRI